MLEVGETQVWTCASVAVTQQQVDAGELNNTATATGTPAVGSLDDATASHTAAITPAPDWNVSSSTSGTLTEAGDVVDYTFAVTNDGNVTIDAVDLQADHCDGTPTLASGDTDLDGQLDVDETWI